MADKCKGGEAVGIDYVNDLIIHEGDAEWHPMTPPASDPKET